MTAGIGENTSKNTHNEVERLLLEESGLQRVLDIPCGAGAFTRRLLDRGIEVHSADIENVMQVENPRFRIVDMNQPLPYDSETFSGLVCIDGIEHLERPFDFVRECHRVVRPGGTLILSTPNISALRSRWRWFITGHHNKGKSPLNETSRDPLHHISLISFPEVRYLLHAEGFRLVAVTTNRIKPVSCAYLPWVPLAMLMTALTYAKEEKDREQRARNREIQRRMFSRAVLFGETLIVKAVRNS